MNRSAINSRVLGSGHSVSRILLAVAEILELVGTLRVSIVKYGRATTDLTLDSSFRLRAKIALACTTELTLVGEVTATVWQRVYGAVVEFITLTSELAGHVNVRLNQVLDSAIEGLVSATVWHRLPTTLTGEMILEGALSGEDLYSGLAPIDRTIAVPGTSRFVAVPGSENTTGV